MTATEIIDNILEENMTNPQMIDGIDSGVGIDYWYIDDNGSEAYVNIDQDHFKITIDGNFVAEGDIDEETSI